MELDYFREATMNRELKWTLQLSLFFLKIFGLLLIFHFYSLSVCLSVVVLYNVGYYLIITYVLKLQYTQAFEPMYSYYDPGCYVCGVLIFDKFASVPQVVKRFEQNFANSRWNRILKQRLVLILNDTYWTPVEDIKFEDHVKIFSQHYKDVNELNQFLSKYMYEEMPNNKPKWEIAIFQNYAESQSVLIVKLEHAYGDGLAFCNAVFLAMDDYEGLPSAKYGPSLWYTITVWLFLPFLVILYGIRYLSLPIDANGIRAAVLTNKGAVGASRVFNIDEMKQVAKKKGNTISELVISICMKGIEWYIKGKGKKTEDSINIAIPAKLSGLQKAETPLKQELGMLVTRFTYAKDLCAEAKIGTDQKNINKKPEYIIKAEECRRQLDETRQVFRQIRGSRLATAIIILFKYIYYVFSPEIVTRFLTYMNKRVTTVISNMAGPTKPLHLCGSKLLECLPVVPVFSTLICNFEMFSYLNKMRIICIADTAAVPNPYELLNEIEGAYDLLLSHY